MKKEGQPTTSIRQSKMLITACIASGLIGGTSGDLIKDGAVNLAAKSADEYVVRCYKDEYVTAWVKTPEDCVSGPDYGYLAGAECFVEINSNLIYNTRGKFGKPTVLMLKYTSVQHPKPDK